MFKFLNDLKLAFWDIDAKIMKLKIRNKSKT